MNNSYTRMKPITLIFHTTLDAPKLCTMQVILDVNTLIV